MNLQEVYFENSLLEWKREKHTQNQSKQSHHKL
jgi:hypothetical protein